MVIPVADRHLDYAREVQDRLVEKGLRIEVDDSANSMQKKIRENARQKIPYLLIVGDREAEQGTVNVRRRGASSRRRSMSRNSPSECCGRSPRARKTLWTRAAGEEYNCWCSAGARVRSTPKRNQSLGGLLAPKFVFERSGAQ